MTSSSSFPPAAADNSAYISAEPLDIVALLAGAHHPGAGALVLFSGEVRVNSLGKEVDFLEYEAYIPLASKMIRQVLEEARSRWMLQAAIAQHRVGRLSIGESAVVVITAAAHRGEAYSANRFIIDKIKHEVPIWKCEYFADGTKVWGGNCNCHAITGDPKKHIYESLSPGIRQIEPLRP
ncbi:MAG: molybdenum cofactor biosynthesis protein MoaE [Puia sp.]|nr:molybdenum cofactor biosynthesis protein MoaE [Puia sp.]